MENLLPKQIQDFWTESSGPIHAYIHAPFCKQICKYCYCKGRSIEVGGKEYNDYYHNHLPQQIDFYKSILSSNRIQSYFFGGGTPTFARPQELKTIFDLLPNFKGISQKIMEIHPADCAPDHIELLGEYGFSAAVLCPQTFDQEIQKNQNRLITDFIQAKKIASQIKSNGMKLFADLILFYQEPKFINALFLDLAYMGLLNVDEITINPYISPKNPIKVENEILDLTIKLIHNFMIHHGFYCLENESGTFEEFDSFFRKPSFIGLRLIKVETPRQKFMTDFSHLIYGMNKSFATKPKEHSILGIGSYKNLIDVFSIINDSLIFIERYDGEKVVYFKD